MATAHMVTMGQDGVLNHSWVGTSTKVSTKTVQPGVVGANSAWAYSNAFFRVTTTALQVSVLLYRVAMLQLLMSILS